MVEGQSKDHTLLLLYVTSDMAREHPPEHARCHVAERASRRATLPQEHLLGQWEHLLLTDPIFRAL